MTLKQGLHQATSFIKQYTVHFVIVMIGSAWEYWLGKTKKIVANSSWELLALLAKRLIKGETKMEKDLVKGQYGGIVLTESAGNVTLSGTLSASLGGGEAQGVVSVSGSIGVTLQASHLIDMGLDLAAAKYPSVASLIAAAKLAIDAELAKA